MDTLTCCDCGCDCSSHIPSAQRKHDESEFEFQNEKPLSSSSSSSNAKVQIENECQLLRETVAAQQESIQDLYAELDEERNAASTAANEAMSMILRLQREKAEVEMELRQFKRFSEDKMEHDRRELLALEDLVYKREQTIQALSFEARAYRHRMMSYGVSEAEVYDDDVDEEENKKRENMYYDDECDYPPLKCSFNENPEVDVVDVEKYTLTDSPLKSLEMRISQMERVPSFGESPRRQRHFRKVSTCSSSSLLGTNRDQRPDLSVDDDMNDRVYTIDSVHQGVSHSGGGGGEEKVRGETVGGELNGPDLGDPDIAKLYARMQALEADRESMRQAIVSMRTEKAQMVLLKEIAQHLSKDVIPERRLLPLRKASIVGVFSFLSVFKWITSFVFWRKKARRSKYMNGVVQANNMGLEMLLEKTPRIRQWRCLSSTQV
ncbi:Myosin-binding protein 7 [Hirschfeldia incana]|nr:Myosin-binding protein 7 [Hirschfeldia incana]